MGRPIHPFRRAPLRTNRSKIRDQRFWKRWRETGDVTIAPDRTILRGRAEGYLHALRDDDDLDPENCIWLLKDALREAGLDLTHLRTSDDELRRLASRHHKRHAQRYLQELRHGVTHAPSNHLWLLRDHLKHGALTAADISTTDDELAQWELKAS